MSLRAGLLGGVVWVASSALAAGGSATPTPTAAPSSKTATWPPPEDSRSPPSTDPQATWKPLISEKDWRARVWQATPEPAVEEEPADPDPFGFSVYHGRRTEPMGMQTLINGARMNIASLIVEDSPQQVTKFYLEALEQAGVGTILRGPVEGAPGVTYLSFRPARSKNLKTLTLVPHGGGCIILASVGNPEQLLEERSVLPSDVPLPPNAETPTAIQQGEPGEGSHSAFFLVRGSSAQKIQSFYREELTHRGYTAVASSEGLPNTDNYQKGRSVLSLSIQPAADPASVAVGIVWFDP